MPTEVDFTLKALISNFVKLEDNAIKKAGYMSALYSKGYFTMEIIVKE